MLQGTPTVLQPIKTPSHLQVEVPQLLRDVDRQRKEGQVLQQHVHVAAQRGMQGGGTERHGENQCAISQWGEKGGGQKGENLKDQCATTYSIKQSGSSYFYILQQ